MILINNFLINIKSECEKNWFWFILYNFNLTFKKIKDIDSSLIKHHVKSKCFVLVELGLPFKYASIIGTNGDEVPLIISKYTLGDIV